MARKKKNDTPIITLAVKTTEQANALLEGFESGESFWKRIWKHKIWSTKQNHTINVLFGHKFFHWCNIHNKRVWLNTAPGVPDIMDWEGWEKLSGEINFPKSRRRIISITVKKVS